MNTLTHELLNFISDSPTAFHAVRTVKKILTDNGFTRLNEGEDWQLLPGGKYYVTRNLSSIIAFTVPDSLKPSSYMIAAAHSDSPSFKIKHNPESDAASYVRINVEKYGGMLCATWLDRPLSCAGRVILNENGRIVTKLIDLNRDLFMIPSLAIHMNRNANEGASYNAAVDMQPICGSASTKGNFMKLIAEACGAGAENIISYDLYLYPRTPGTVWGVNNEFVSSPRLDDLQCVFASLKGLISAEKSDALSLLLVTDNEEVGSSTKQGADSTFLYDTLRRINRAVGGSDDDYTKTVASSFMVSADNAHAIHPNHPEYADKTNAPIMNGGIVIKHAASQTYTTDAVSSAIFTSICKKAEVPVQHFTNRSDLRGGSTLGNISGTQVSVNTVDIGLPQLAMHSSYETAGVLDTEYLVKAMKMLFSSEVISHMDGEYEIK